MAILLVFASPDPGSIDLMPYQGLIRTGNEQELLLGDWPSWRSFRELRAWTGRTCDEAVALEAVAGIPAFLREAVFLRDRLSERTS